MTIRAEPIASGAMSPAANGLMTVIPTVSTRKNVPMNSTTYLRIERTSRVEHGSAWQRELNREYWATTTGNCFSCADCAPTDRVRLQYEKFVQYVIARPSGKLV